MGNNASSSGGGNQNAPGSGGSAHGGAVNVVSGNGGSSRPVIVVSSASPVLVCFRTTQNLLVAVTKNTIEYFEPLNTTTRKAMVALKGPPTTCAVFVEAEDLLITGDEEGRLRWYQASSGALSSMFPSQDPREALPEEDAKDGTTPFSSSPQSSKSSPIRSLLLLSSHRLAAGCNDGSVRVFSRAPGHHKEVASLNQSHSAVLSMAFEPGRQILLAGCADGIIRGFNLETNSMLFEMKGHEGSILSLSIARVADLLVSSSIDSTIRLWNVDTRREVAGYKFFTQSMFYDDVRDILFLGTNTGTTAIAKVSTIIGEVGVSAELRVLQKTPAHKAAILSMHYVSQKDMLVTSAFDCRIGLWSDVTKIPYSGALEKAQQLFAIDEDSMTEENVGQLIEKWNESEPFDFGSLHLIASEQKLFEQCIQLLEERKEQSKERKAKILDGFNQVKGSFQTSLEESYNEFVKNKNALGKKYEASLDPEKGRMSLEEEIALEKEELKKKQEREWEELSAKQEAQRKSFEDQLPVLRRRAACQFMAMQQRFLRQQSQVEAQTSTALRKFITGSFPVLNGSYQIGDLLTPTSSTVFRGLDLNSLELVVIKAFPSMVTLETSLQHSTLVPIIDVCQTEDTTFVVMDMMKGNLSEFVKRQTQPLSSARVGSIVYSLFKSLAFLHSNRMVVRDLRPQQILLDHDGSPRLIHLGVMRSLLGTAESEPTEEGRVYAAPELFGRVVKGSSDIWSLGCTFAYLLQTPAERKKPLFHGNTSKEILLSMVETLGKPSQDDLKKMGADCKMAEDGLDLLKYIAELPEEPAKRFLKEQFSQASSLALDLLSKMLKFVPQKRISAQEALQHSYFQQFGLIPSLSECELLPHTDLTSTISDDDTSENETFQDEEEIIEDKIERLDEKDDKEDEKEEKMDEKTEL